MAEILVGVKPSQGETPDAFFNLRIFLIDLYILELLLVEILLVKVVFQIRFGGRHAATARGRVGIRGGGHPAVGGRCAIYEGVDRAVRRVSGLRGDQIAREERNPRRVA